MQSNPPPGRAAWVKGALEAHEAPLVRYTLRMTGDLELARDVVQDAFLRLCAEDPGRLDGHLAPWLYRVCRNRALDVMKKERRMQPLATGQAEAQASRDPGPGAAAEAAETGGHIRAALAVLPDAQQEAFRLKFQHQLTYKEIAEVTGHTVNHVRYLIHTALKQLREQLRGRLDTATDV